MVFFIKIMIINLIPRCLLAFNYLPIANRRTGYSKKCFCTSTGKPSCTVTLVITFRKHQDLRLVHLLQYFDCFFIVAIELGLFELVE